jgi:two-component system, sensor histidine kinase ChiS
VSNWRFYRRQRHLNISTPQFAKLAINKESPFTDKEEIATCRDDVNIIENALKFVNELLRNMLDMHRAMNKQLQIKLSPTDVLHDVLEPIQCMLASRGSMVTIEINCPQHFYVLSDSLRLNQVVLNLGRNSVKFVEEGFVRLSAAVVDGHVRISVEDSGPGIPAEKKVCRTLFS